MGNARGSQLSTCSNRPRGDERLYSSKGSRDQGIEGSTERGGLPPADRGGRCAGAQRGPAGFNPANSNWSGHGVRAELHSASIQHESGDGHEGGRDWRRLALGRKNREELAKGSGIRGGH